MLKKILIICALLAAGLITLQFFENSKSRTFITPYPYSFQEKYAQSFKKQHAQEIKSAENAQILILGDQMGKSLDPYIDRLKDQYKDYLKSDDSVFNWASDNEGLFRTLFKLKTLSTLPPIIIYFGAGSELKEQRFDTFDAQIIKHNFNVFKDEKLISLIITFPFLSHFLYQETKHFNLAEYKEYNSLLSSADKMTEKEVAYEIFNYEARDFIKYVQENRSDLIIVSNPINLEAPPHEVCAHSSNEDIIGVQQEIESMIKEGAYKSAMPEIEKLAAVTFSNARSYYLLGITFLRTGKIKEGRLALHKAAIFDCQNWRGNAVYNSILKKAAKDNLASFIDFDLIANSKSNSDGIFLDEIYPHNTIYLQLIGELNLAMKSYFRVTE